MLIPEYLFLDLFTIPGFPTPLLYSAFFLQKFNLSQYWVEQ